MKLKNLLALLLFCGLPTLSLSGCVLAALGVGGTAVETVTEERTAGTKLDDNSLYWKLKNVYSHAEGNDLFANVTINVTEGRVLLTGNVDKAESKPEAVRLAWTVYGVRGVDDEIEVNDKSSFGNYLTDVWISNQIRPRLLAEKGIHSTNYSVTTVNQVVYISGIAQSKEELDKVTYIASTTGHVQRVVNYAVLKDDPRRIKAPLP